MSGSRISVTAVAFLILPAAMIAPKSITILLAVAGLAAIYETRGELFNRTTSPAAFLFWPLTLVFFSAALGALMHGASSGDLGRMAIHIGKVAGISLLGIALLTWILNREARFEPPQFKLLLAGLILSLIAAGIYLIALYEFDLMLWGTNILEQTASLSIGTVLLSVFAVPLAIVLARNSVLTSAILILLVFATNLVVSPSRIIELLLGCIFALACMSTNRGFRVSLLSALTASIIVLPVIAGMFAEQLVEIVVTYVSDTSILHRFYIWEFSVGNIVEKPLLGWGFGASRNIPGGDVMPPYGMAYMPLHPHNGFIQAWLELGLLGAASVIWVCIAIIRRIARLGRSGTAIFGAAFLSTLFSFSFYFGLWQSWWLSCMWLIAAISILLSREQSAEGATSR